MVQFDIPSPPEIAEAAWDALERLGRNLPTCLRRDEQARLVADAVFQGTPADIVYWYTGNEVSTTAGRLNRTPEELRVFASQMLLATPGAGSQILQADLEEWITRSGSAPQTGIMIRLRRSPATWLVALSFNGDRPLTTDDQRIMTLARRLLLNHWYHLQVSDRWRDTALGLIRCLTAAMEAKDPYLAGHSDRVAKIAVRLGRQMRLSEAELNDLQLAGLLHDIGKIGIRDEVLLKANDLTPAEVAHLREHPVIGDGMVAHIKAFSHLRPGIRNHHERWDGKGYPDKLGGEKIPLMARILAIADAFDAMTSPRIFRTALPPRMLEAVLREEAGIQWDPTIIQHFRACRDDLFLLRQQATRSAPLEALEQVTHLTMEKAADLLTDY